MTETKMSAAVTEAAAVAEAATAVTEAATAEAATAVTEAATAEAAAEAEAAAVTEADAVTAVTEAEAAVTAEEWRARAEAAEAELARRDFEAALERGLSGVRFTSEAARRDITARIRAAGLPVGGGELCGLAELLAGIKAEDSGAFAETAPVRFTEPLAASAEDAEACRRSIMEIRDRAARRSAIAEHIGLFVSRGETNRPTRIAREK